MITRIDNASKWQIKRLFYANSYDCFAFVQHKRGTALQLWYRNPHIFKQFISFGLRYTIFVLAFFNTFRTRQTFIHFADNISNWIFLNAKVWSSPKFSDLAPSNKTVCVACCIGCCLQTKWMPLGSAVYKQGMYGRDHWKGNVILTTFLLVAPEFNVSDCICMFAVSSGCRNYLCSHWYGKGSRYYI